MRDASRLDDLPMRGLSLGAEQVKVKIVRKREAWGLKWMSLKKRAAVKPAVTLQCN